MPKKFKFCAWNLNTFFYNILLTILQHYHYYDVGLRYHRFALLQPKILCFQFYCVKSYDAKRKYSCIIFMLF